MHPLIFLAALINTCGSSSSRDETAEDAQTHGGNPFCWEGAYDYKRCCIARDASCWSGGFLDWESCCLDPDKAVFISPECHTIAANHFFICGNEELEGFYQQRKSISYWMYQFGANFSQKVQSVLPTLDSNTHLSILDIGVGMGAVDIALQRHYGKKVSFIYMDKSRFEPKRMSLISHGSQSGFGEQHPFYGNLECARQIAWMNGLQEVKLIELASGHGISDLDEHSVDIVLSSSSWGFHYPIEMYISDVMRVLKVEGLILVSLRTGTDGFTILSRHGLDCKYLSQDAHREWVKCSRAPQKNLEAEFGADLQDRGMDWDFAHNTTDVVMQQLPQQSSESLRVQLQQTLSTAGKSGQLLSVLKDVLESKDKELAAKREFLRAQLRHTLTTAAKNGRLLPCLKVLTGAQETLESETKRRRVSTDSSTDTMRSVCL